MIGGDLCEGKERDQRRRRRRRRVMVWRVNLGRVGFDRNREKKI